MTKDELYRDAYAEAKVAIRFLRAGAVPDAQAHFAKCAKLLKEWGNGGKTSG